MLITFTNLPPSPRLPGGSLPFLPRCILLPLSPPPLPGNDAVCKHQHRRRDPDSQRAFPPLRHHPHPTRLHYLPPLLSVVAPVSIPCLQQRVLSSPHTCLQQRVFRPLLPPTGSWLFHPLSRFLTSPSQLRIHHPISNLRPCRFVACFPRLLLRSLPIFGLRSPPKARTPLHGSTPPLFPPLSLMALSLS